MEILLKVSHQKTEKSLIGQHIKFDTKVNWNKEAIELQILAVVLKVTFNEQIITAYYCSATSFVAFSSCHSSWH